MSGQSFKTAALDSPEAEDIFMAAAGLSGSAKKPNNRKKPEFKTTSQNEFLRFLAQRKTDAQDKTGIGYHAEDSSQSEDQIGGWSPAKTSLVEHAHPEPSTTSKIPPVAKHKSSQTRVETGGWSQTLQPTDQPTRAFTQYQQQQPVASMAPLKEQSHPTFQDQFGNRNTTLRSAQEGPRAPLMAVNHQQKQPQQPMSSKFPPLGQSFVREGVKNPKPKRTSPNKAESTTYWAEVPAPEVEIQAPNLKYYRIPRRDKMCGGSNRSRLSSVSATGVGSTTGADDGLGGIKDIRNELGLRGKFGPPEPVVEDEWVPYTVVENDDMLWEPEYLDPFISAWRQFIPQVKANFIEDCVPEHWNCDVNPTSGELLEPISFPETLVNDEKLDQETDWRRQNWTSSLLIRRQLQFLQRDRGHNRQISDRRAKPADLDQAVAAPVVMAEPPAPRRVPYVVRPADDGIVYPRFVPRMPCFLRPAERIDMEAVARIYEMEMKNGLQVFDSKPLTSDDWEKILAKAKELGMPFIVAVRGNVLNLGLDPKKGNMLFSNFSRVPKDVKDPQGLRAGEILGFGFCSAWQFGLGGSPWGAGRGSARMHCYVHPDYRRKYIGFSMMDMLLYCTSSRYITQQTYDFVDPEKNPVYLRPGPRCDTGNGKRIFMCVYAGYFVKHRLVPYKDPKLELVQKDYDKDLEWVRKLFDELLVFDEKTRLYGAYRTAKHREGEPHWLDEILFEHQCQWDPRFHEDADKY